MAASDLRTIPLFHGFTDEELVELSGLFTRITPPSGRPLFDLDEPASALYLLTKGEVVLDCPGDDTFQLRPPALIGELGALTGLARSTRATVSPGAEVWELPADKVRLFVAENHDLGVRLLANLLAVVADKVQRDQRRMADMRKNLIATQKDLKRLRELVLESAETPISAPVHDTLEKLITHNRRVNYRVEPPPALAAHVRFDHGAAPISDISRTHVTVHLPVDPPVLGTWLSGVAHLAGTEIPISGRVARIAEHRMTLELDLMIDEFTAALEGYLTRAQLLDVLC